MEWYNDFTQYVVIASSISDVPFESLSLSEVPCMHEDDLHVNKGLLARRSAWYELDSGDRQFVKGYCRGFLHGYERNKNENKK